MKVLVTAPPMARMIDEFRPIFEKAGVEVTCPEIRQTLTEGQLVELLPSHDGWIIGDDPATRRVFEAGRTGRFRAAMKWGVGVDNIDFAAAESLGIPIANTPGVFSGEVADVAMCYVIGLARELFTIDRGVKSGDWPKPAGISLAGRTVGLVGFGNVGRACRRRLEAADLRIIVYDPALSDDPSVDVAKWPERLGECDFLVFTCALTPRNRHMLSRSTLRDAKRGVRIVNVARGSLIDEAALAEALESGLVHSAALDVFEEEPLPAHSPLRAFPRCILGSHNASNSVDAVRRTSDRAIRALFGYLGIESQP
jgi:D-3-phosphoglycerate dehydrogenase